MQLNLPKDLSDKIDALPHYNDVAGWHEGHKTSFCEEAGCNKPAKRSGRCGCGNRISVRASHYNGKCAICTMKEAGDSRLK